MPRSYRIVKARHANSAFDGEGARIAGGRWNSPGVAMVYTAGSIALAALEMLVHLERSELLAAYVIFTCTFDPALVSEPDALPSDWRSSPAPAASRRVGDAWVLEGRSAVLLVPSAVVEEEHNYVLNPRHRDFEKIQVSQPRPFRFDPRLVH
jgi:RES domain-containing protein